MREGQDLKEGNGNEPDMPQRLRPQKVEQAAKSGES